MATTTPNFGWTVPTSTDLVKDGATAIETLGDGIDASFVGLKGGTTGQVLSKTSGTDLAFTWVAQDDSNAIQNAIVDAKGDLIGATAADTPARLAVGTNGQVLTADSTASTGLKWATVGAGALTKIRTESFSSVSAVNVNSVFSATYKNYMIVAEVTNSSNDNDVRLRLRSSGTDATTNYTILGAISAGSSVSADNSTGSFPMIRAGGTTMGFGNATIFSPFSASFTGWTSTSIGAAGYWASQSGRHTANTSYDGFSFIPSSGTMTGTYTLYGMEA
jgi:hypothetical protein